MTTRERFEADHAKLVAALERPTAAVQDNGDMRALRLMQTLMRSFVDRWPDLPANSREGRHVAGLRTDCADVEASLESYYLHCLLEAVSLRIDWKIEEQLLRMSTRIPKLIELAPEPLRTKILKIQTDALQCEYDPEQQYRESEAAAEKAEAAWKASFADIADYFPERLTAELRARLTSDDPEVLGAFQQELTAKLGKTESPA